ncbi:Holliday junction resolvase RuvX [Leekyejoonella antrihumi]|uniref:Holliday junction resolvase RuvX n=1 Tax=Leekyejoonella antrihumi TaxID=1660198 RepID=UPI00319EAF2F
MRLGVDVGSVRVGVAACDPAGAIATPVATLTRAPAKGTDLDAVVLEVHDRNAIEVVVGLPLTLSGDEGPAAQIARAWATELHRRLPGVPVRLVDERLTTVDAHRAMRDAGVDQRASRKMIDQQAAVLILQVALDSERNSGNPAGESVGGRKPRHRSRRANAEGQS